MRHVIGIVAIVLELSMAPIGCSPDPKPAKAPQKAKKETMYEDSTPPETQEWKDFQKVIDSNSEFAFSFYKTLPYQSSNVIYSPFSIYTGLAAVAAGAEGATREELISKMHFPEEEILHQQTGIQLQYLARQCKNKLVEIHNATRAWANTDLKVLEFPIAGSAQPAISADDDLSATRDGKLQFGKGYWFPLYPFPKMIPR